MARIDYEAVAKDYQAGRGLTADGLSAWREALAPYLSGVRLPILDVGSGIGQFAPLLAGWFEAEVVGVEPSDAMRREAVAENSHPRVRYVDGEAAHLPLADGSCGAAWLSTVIHHVPDLAAAAWELRRVLAPGAPVLIRGAFPGRTGRITLFQFFPEAAQVVETFPSVERVDREFGTAGFRRIALDAVPQVSAASLREFRDRVALRADTTLRGIGDEAFEQGLRRLDDAAAAETDAPQPIVDWLDLLVLR